MKLIIFDVGGVVCSNTSVVDHLSSYLNLSRKQFLDFAYQSGLHKLHEGKVCVKDFWEKFSELYGKTIEEDLWAKFFKPDLIVETVEIILELKKKHRIVAGTNTIESHYKIHTARNDYRFFDSIYASHIIGISKPDTRFFNHILEKEKVKPEDTVFIDDTSENVESAAKLGIKSILFTSAQELRRQLPLIL